MLIVDWDIHHGNGTQRMFETSSKVLYISLHRYDYGDFFPKSTDGDAKTIGSGRGKGYTVNIPWNKVSVVILFNKHLLPRFVLFTTVKNGRH